MPPKSKQGYSKSITYQLCCLQHKDFENALWYISRLCRTSHWAQKINGFRSETTFVTSERALSASG